jgi:Tfp pilus assembly protein PilF
MAMDGRWKWALTGGVLCGLLGCSTTNSQPFAPAPPPQMSGHNSVFVPEPADDGVAREGPLAPSTMLLFASMWVEAVSKDPNKPAADRDRLLTQARHAYQDVLHKDPHSVDALIGLGGLYQVTGESQKLREVEQRAKTLHPNNAKVWAWVAVRRAQAKDFDAAVEAYGQAVKLDPENRLHRIHLGLTLARAKRYEEGREWLLKTMREGEARYNLAMMMLHNGDTDKARMELTLVLHVDPSMQVAKDQLMAMAATGAAAVRPEIRTVGHEEVAPRP